MYFDENGTRVWQGAVALAEPLTEAIPMPEEPLNDYRRGFLDALKATAWKEHGVQYVSYRGISGIPLREAMERFLISDCLLDRTTAGKIIEEKYGVIRR